MTSTDTTKTTTTATVNKTATDAKPAKVGIAQITGHRDCSVMVIVSPSWSSE